MAMTNAERQAAWRTRRERQLRNLTERFEEEVERRVATLPLRNGGEQPTDMRALEEQIEDLKDELDIARGVIKTLRRVTRLDPAGVVAALQPHLDSLESEGRKNMATAAPQVIPYRVQLIERCLADWQGIKGYNELAKHCRASLKTLYAIRRKRGSTKVWGPDEIAQTAKLTAQLKHQIEQWAHAVT